MNPNMVFMTESRTLTRPTAMLQNMHSSEKKKLKEGDLGEESRHVPCGVA